MNLTNSAWIPTRQLRPGQRLRIELDEAQPAGPVLLAGAQARTRRDSLPGTVIEIGQCDADGPHWFLLRLDQAVNGCKFVRVVTPDWERHLIAERLSHRIPA